MLLLVELGPGIILPFALKNNNAELLGHILRATNDRTDFLGQVVDVLSILEQLVVLGMGEQLRACVFVMFEDQASANRMDVEAVINDGAQFGLELVVVDGLVAGDVDLQFRWFRPGESIHRQGAEPESTDDLVAVRHGCRSHGHGVVDRFEIAHGLFPQVFVQLIGHGVQQGGHPLFSFASEKSAAVMIGCKGLWFLYRSTRILIRSRCFLGIGGNENLIVEQF